MKKVFYIHINENDETGMDAISLVDYPAVKRNFLCFEEDKKPVMVKMSDEAQKIITGVVCLADTPIYRYDKELGEYYVVFTKEVIKQMMEKYGKQGLWNSVNLQHDDDKFVNSCVMIESYLKDSERGINPSEFSDIPDGSWLMSFKVEDEDLWNDIINGDKLNGFSLQGIFNYSLSKDAFEDESDFDNWIKKYL